jgi:hypothetical protein
MCIYLYLNIICTINEVITSSINQALGLLLKDHQFESHKPHGY